MATLQQQRTAIAADVAAGRQANGEAERKATARNITEERTGQAVVDDINALIRPERQRRQQRAVQPVGAVPASQGRGVYTPRTTTGGIASPVVEPDYAVREFWPGGMPSSDGLLVLPAWKRVVMTDANGAEVIFDYAEPV